MIASFKTVWIGFQRFLESVDIFEKKLRCFNAGVSPAKIEVLLVRRRFRIRCTLWGTEDSMWAMAVQIVKDE